MALLGSVTFVGLGMTLLEEVHHREVGFEVSYAQATPSVMVDFLWPSDKDVACTMSVYIVPCSLP